MSFYVIASIFALVVALGTIVPVFWRAQASPDAFEYDREVYKSRLEELDRELSLGSINAEQHEYAVSEEGRRLLSKAPENGSKETSPRHSKFALGVAMISFAFIPLFSIYAYTQFGASGSPDLPLQARLNKDPRGQSVQELVQRAENQLARNPDDGRGWKIIAPIYVRLNRLDDAENAYRNAIRVIGEDAELYTALGEVLSIKDQGRVGTEARSLFENAAKLDPGNAKPQFFLAIALNQEEKYPEAELAWRTLIDKSPDNAPWIRVAQQQLALARTKQGKSADLANGKDAPRAPGNPTKEDIEAAGEMSASDRMQFINDMVERLEAELEENPKNKAGWQRMVRSYIVLGRKDDALKAIEKATSVFTNDTEFVGELAKIRASLTN